MSSGSHSAASSGCARSAGTAAKVIVIGQPWPASTWPRGQAQRGARDVGARLRLGRPGQRVQPVRDASVMSSCQAGWNSTSSMRLPKRSWVRSTRRVLVGRDAPLERLAAPGRADLDGALVGPAAALALAAPSTSAA